MTFVNDFVTFVATYNDSYDVFEQRISMISSCRFRQRYDVFWCRFHSTFFDDVVTFFRDVGQYVNNTSGSSSP